MYSKLYYETKLKSIIQERWNEECRTKNPNLPPGEVSHPTMGFRNKTIKTLFEEEDNNVKAEVNRKRESMEGDAKVNSKDDKEGEDNEELERKRRSAGIQRYTHISSMKNRT